MLLSSIVGIYTLLSQEIFTYRESLNSSAQIFDVLFNVKQGILVYWFLLCIVISVIKSQIRCHRLPSTDYTQKLLRIY